MEMEDVNITVKRIVLEVENELQILIDENTTDVAVELESGLAEIFGTEMTLHQEYKFPSNCSIAIFSWQGCTLKISGHPASYRVVEDTLMILSVTAHAYLQDRRNRARESGQVGPVTIIAGPTDAGKSTLCRSLLSYAARMGNRPLFVELDVGQNSISVPGTMGILAVKEPADVINGFEVRASKIFNFGLLCPGHDMSLYFLMMKHLAAVTKEGLDYANPNVKSSGIIINTSGWCRGAGYDIITGAAMSFDADNIIVISEDRLFEQLQRDMPSKVKVNYLPRQKGVVERSRVMRFKSREARISEYFYGPLNQLKPHEFTLPYANVYVMQAKVCHPVNNPVNHTTTNRDCVKLFKVPLSVTLMGQVLALLKHSPDVRFDVPDLAFAEVLGFVGVTRVDLVAETITVVSPQPKPLPSLVFLLGERKLPSHCSS